VQNSSLELTLHWIGPYVRIAGSVAARFVWKV